MVSDISMGLLKLYVRCNFLFVSKQTSIHEGAGWSHSPYRHGNRIITFFSTPNEDMCLLSNQLPHDFFCKGRMIQYGMIESPEVGYRILRISSNF